MLFMKYAKFKCDEDEASSTASTLVNITLVMLVVKCANSYISIR